MIKFDTHEFIVQTSGMSIGSLAGAIIIGAFVKISIADLATIVIISMLLNVIYALFTSYKSQRIFDNDRV